MQRNARPTLMNLRGRTAVSALTRVWGWLRIHTPFESLADVTGGLSRSSRALQRTCFGMLDFGSPPPPVVQTCGCHGVNFKVPDMTITTLSSTCNILRAKKSSVNISKVNYVETDVELLQYCRPQAAQ